MMFGRELPPCEVGLEAEVGQAHAANPRREIRRGPARWRRALRSRTAVPEGEFDSLTGAPGVE